MEMHKKESSWNRRIMLAYLLILFGHFLVDHFAIIYPSLVFPSFSDAHKIDKTISIKTMELYGVSGGRSIRLSEKDFFQDINYKHSFYMLNTIARKELKAGTDKRVTKQREVFQKYAKAQLTRMYPTMHFDSIRINQSQRQYNVERKTLEDKVVSEKNILIPLS